MKTSKNSLKLRKTKTSIGYAFIFGVPVLLIIVLVVNALKFGANAFIGF